MKLNLEIRTAEGGDDAKALVDGQASSHTAFAQRQGLPVTAKAGRG